MPITRLAASRQTANASGSNLSRLSPLLYRCLNSSVFADKSASPRADIVGSSALILSTILRMRLSSRSFLVPKIPPIRLANMNRLSKSCLSNEYVFLVVIMVLEI